MQSNITFGNHIQNYHSDVKSVVLKVVSTIPSGVGDRGGKFQLGTIEYMGYGGAGTNLGVPGNYDTSLEWLRAAMYQAHT